MWNKLFGGGDGLPREKVDAVVRVIDRYLGEEATLRNLQSEKQTIHPRDLPPDKRRALTEEVGVASLAEAVDELSVEAVVPASVTLAGYR